MSAASQTPIANQQSSIANAFGALIVHSFQRHWRVRQLGWAAVGLLTIVVMWVGAISASPAGWRLEERRVRGTRVSHRDYADQLLLPNRYTAAAKRAEESLQEYPPKDRPRGPLRPVHPIETPTPLEPLRDSLTTLLLSVPAAVLQAEEPGGSKHFLGDWAFVKFTQQVPLGVYVSFILPMFTLAYASGAIGSERESRSLVWLLTRPVPRPLVYLGTFLGALPWCLAFSGGGFAAVCLAGGAEGRRALALYWPAALAGTLAFSALFHLVGAVFRRPVVVGLVYVFFFELLVAALPGSLKQLSLAFYTRCLMYNEASAAGFPVEMLEVPGAVSATTAAAVLAAITVGLTALGMVLFSRTEFRDDV